MRKINKLTGLLVAFLAFFVIGVSGTFADGLIEYRCSLSDGIYTWAFDDQTPEEKCQLTSVAVVIKPSGKKVPLKKDKPKDGFTVGRMGKRPYLQAVNVLDPVTKKPLNGLQNLAFRCGQKGELLEHGVAFQNGVANFRFQGDGCAAIDFRLKEDDKEVWLKRYLDLLEERRSREIPLLKELEKEFSDPEESKKFAAILRYLEAQEDKEDNSKSKGDKDNPDGISKTISSSKSFASSAASANSSAVSDRASVGTSGKNLSDALVSIIRLIEGDKGKNSYTSSKKNGRFDLRLKGVINPATGKPLKGSHTVRYLCTEFDADKASKEKTALFSRGSSSFETACLYTKPTDVVAVVK